MGGDQKATTDDVLEELEFIARTPNRVQILEALSETGQVEKDELQAAIDGERTTLTRNLDALEDRGLIRRSNPACMITPSGEALIEHFLDMLETGRVAVRFQEFFQWISADEFDLNLQALADAELYVTESGDPWAMINRHIEVIREMDEGRAILPFTGLHAQEAAYERVVHEGARGELVVNSHVADTLETNPQYRDIAEELVATGRFDIYKYEGSIPYAINILDETVQLVAADGDEPRAMLESDAEAVFDWAERTYEEYKRQATFLF